MCLVVELTATTEIVTLNDPILSTPIAECNNCYNGIVPTPRKPLRSPQVMYHSGDDKCVIIDEHYKLVGLVGRDQRLKRLGWPGFSVTAFILHQWYSLLHSSAC